jgi:hypothetical protein
MSVFSSSVIQPDCINFVHGQLRRMAIAALMRFPG